LKIKYSPYDEVNFWLAFTPLTDENDRIRGFLIEFFRRRLDIYWRKGRFDD
jgi:hypothetical protein